MSWLQKKHAVYFSASFLPAAKPSFLTEWLHMYKVNAHVLTFKSIRINLPTQFQINLLPIIFLVILNKYIRKTRYDIHTPHILELYFNFCLRSRTYKVIAHKHSGVLYICIGKYWHMHVIFWQKKNKHMKGTSFRPTISRLVRP